MCKRSSQIKQRKVSVLGLMRGFYKLVREKFGSRSARFNPRSLKPGGCKMVAKGRRRKSRPGHWKGNPRKETKVSKRAKAFALFT